MKQVELTDTIREKLKAAAGPDVDLNNLAVFRATALNTLPVRKNHPVYKGGVHTPSFLREMQAAVASESKPLQAMHDGEALPIGRIFHGEVVDLAGRTELQVLFWVDKTGEKGAEYASLVNNGTVDQVSVAVLPKSALSNKSGFDFLGDDATFENIWTGTDPDGNVMGKDGAHVIMNSLDNWFEMSLVGQGGIQGARIHPSTGAMKLAASGLDAPPMTLMLSVTEPQDTKTMDLTELVTQLTNTKVDLAAANAKAATAEAALVAANAKVADLETRLTAATPAAEQLSTVQASLTKATDALKGLYSHVGAVIGAVARQVPEDVEALINGVKEDVQKLNLASRGRSAGLDASSGAGDRSTPSSNSAFKRR